MPAIPQRAALLLQFLVGDAQLFLLDLQLLALPLGFLQQLQCALAQHGGAQGHADGRLAAAQQLELALLGRRAVGETQFQHARDRALRCQAGHRKAARGAAAEGGHHVQVAGGRLAQLHAAMRGRSPHEPLPHGDLPGNLLRIGGAGRHQPQAGAFELVDRAERGAGFLGQDAQGALRQLGDRVLAHEGVGDAGVRLLEPQGALQRGASQQRAPDDDADHPAGPQAQGTVGRGHQRRDPRRRGKVAHDAQGGGRQGGPQGNVRARLVEAGPQRQKKQNPFAVAQGRDRVDRRDHQQLGNDERMDDPVAAFHLLHHPGVPRQ